MAKRNNNNQQSAWESWGKKLTVIITFLAVISSGYAIYKEFKKDIVIDKTISADVEITYLNMQEDSYLFRERDTAVKTDKLYLDYPTARNEISNERLVSDDVSTVDAYAQDQYITFLVIENKGKVDMTDVMVELNLFEINDTLKVDEGVKGSLEDHIRSLGNGKNVVLSLPSRLAAGEGIRIPLFISVKSLHRNADPKRWSVISRDIYLPNKIIFTDPSSDKPKEKKIREMRDPVTVSLGIEIRG